MEVVAVFKDPNSRCAIRVDITTSHTFFIMNTGEEYAVMKMSTPEFNRWWDVLVDYDPKKAAQKYLSNTLVPSTSDARRHLNSILEIPMSEPKTFRAPSAAPKAAPAAAKAEEKKEAAPKKTAAPAKKAATKAPAKKAATKAPAKKAAAPKKEAPKAKAAKKEAVERAPRIDPSEVTVRLAKNPPAGVGLAKRDIVIVEILQANGKKMTLAKLLKEMAKKIDTKGGRTMESVWHHHGAPAQILRSEGIVVLS